jgi:hypothetical protein
MGLRKRMKQLNSNNKPHKKLRIFISGFSMRAGISIRWSLFATILLFTTTLFSGNDTTSLQRDSAKVTSVFTTPESASEYLHELLQQESFRRTEDVEGLMPLLLRLLDHYREPFDSVRSRLNIFPFDSLVVPVKKPLLYDTFPLRWLDSTGFIIDTTILRRPPVVIRKTVIAGTQDVIALFPEVVSEELKGIIDSVFQKRDTIIERVIDTRYLKSRGVQLHRIAGDRIDPPLMEPDTLFTVQFLPDSSGVIIQELEVVPPPDPLNGAGGAPKFTLGDSLAHAVTMLLNHTIERDSTLLLIGTTEGALTPFWITGGSDELIRYWVKNHRNDSITIWLGNPATGQITLTLEEVVHVSRPVILRVDDIPVTKERPDLTLLAVKPLEEIPSSWKYGFASSLSLNQNHLSNWSKGGSSSLSSMVDVLARADYTNKKTKENWKSSGRLRYGTIRTKEQGFRSNTDILEFNSQYNRVYKEKLDFSTVLYFKTQIAKGYKPPNDSVAISKFLNPGSFIVGVGGEYKPFSHTKINVSPLSYRNTFVLDTGNILQTTHGIEKGFRSRQEFGGQIVLQNSMTLFEDLKMSHALRLFSSYLDKPQNIDVDWEMSLEKQINWFFTIKFNLHLIYDDDILFPVLDDDDNPILFPDGTPKKGPRTQVNQFLGLTLSFML